MNIDIKKVWNLKCPSSLDLWCDGTRYKASVSSYKPRTACLPPDVINRPSKNNNKNDYGKQDKRTM